MFNERKKAWRVSWSAYEYASFGTTYQPVIKEKYFGTSEDASKFVDQLSNAYAILEFTSPVSRVVKHEVELN